MTFSQRLEERGVSVIYPGLASHPQHQLMSRLANPGYGYGGIFCIDLETADRANRFLEILQNQEGFGYIAVSLGYFDTLLSCSASSTSSEMSPADLSRAGISSGLIRVSIGFTGSLEQRWDQLQDALERLGV